MQFQKVARIPRGHRTADSAMCPDAVMSNWSRTYSSTLPVLAFHGTNLALALDRQLAGPKPTFRE